KTESMLVVTAEDEDSAPSRDVARHFEDPSYGYTEISRRGSRTTPGRTTVSHWSTGCTPTWDRLEEEENEGKSTQRQEGPGEEQPQAPNCIKAATPQPVFRPSPGCFL
ncbi:unnamed protein product, partial [Tetraodon nigroviridis]